MPVRIRRVEINRLWGALRQAKCVHDLAWLVAGDFNQVGSSSELSGGAPVSHSRCQKWNSFLDDCDLFDLGASGPAFTWCNMRNGLARIRERIDKAFANPKWRHAFPEAWVHNLPRTHSDHHPVLVDLEGAAPPAPSNRPFRFEAAWCLHENFGELISNNWLPQGELPQAINHITSVLKEWNPFEFGNIFQNKRRLLARLEGTQKAMAHKFAPPLLWFVWKRSE